MSLSPISTSNCTSADVGNVHSPPAMNMQPSQLPPNGEVILLICTFFSVLSIVLLFFCCFYYYFCSVFVFVFDCKNTTFFYLFQCFLIKKIKFLFCCKLDSYATFSIFFSRCRCFVVCFFGVFCGFSQKKEGGIALPPTTKTKDCLYGQCGLYGQPIGGCIGDEQRAARRGEVGHQVGINHVGGLVYDYRQLHPRGTL